MILTDAELTGLSAVSGGGRLPGVPLTTRGRAAAMSALKSLQARNILDGRGRATGWGAVPVRAVEQYRKADRHVFVNQLKLSLNEDGAVTVMHPAPEGWSLARMSPIAVMLVLLRAYPFLSQGGAEEISPTQWEPLSKIQWMRARLAEETPVMVVRDTCISQHQSRVVAYDSRGGMGFAYDMTEGQGRSCPVWVIRREIAGLLGCDPSPLKEDGDV